MQQHVVLRFAGGYVIRRRDAALDRRANVQPRIAEIDRMSDEVVFAQANIRCGLHVQIGPPAQGIERTIERLRNLGDPRVEHHGDRRGIEDVQAFFAARLDDDTTRGCKGNGGRAVVGRMQQMMFLPAVRLSGARVVRGYEQRPFAIAWNAVEFQSRLNQRLGLEAFYRIAPQARQGSQNEHVRKNTIGTVRNPQEAAAMKRLGAVFERAVTLYVQNAVSFSVPALLPAAPIVASRLVLLRRQTTYQEVLVHVEHPHRAVSLTGMADGTVAWIALFALLELALLPFLWATCAAGIQSIDARNAWDWRLGVKATFRKVPALLAVAIGQLLLLAAGTCAAVLALALPLALVVASTHSAPSAALYGGPIAVAIALLWLAAMIVLYVSAGFAADAVAVEGLDAGRALASGLARLFNRREFSNALAVALALFAMSLGTAAVGGAVEFFFSGMLHSEVAAIAASTLLSIVQMTFSGVAIAVYYFDVRVRREGCDIQDAVDRLRSLPAM